MARLSSRQWTLIVVLVILVPLLAWAAYFSVLVVKNVTLIKSGKNPTLLSKQLEEQASIARTITTATVTADDLRRIEPSGPEPVLGNPRAAVRIVLFVDYQCPFCKRTAPVIREFMRTHANDAALILRDFPILELHPDAETVAVAARCVFAQNDSNRFWRYHDRLFASQDAQSPDNLRLYARQVGADLAAYDRCVASNEPLGHIRASFADGVAAGVHGTPTFFWNGVKIQGAVDADTMELIFQEVKKQVET